MKDNRIGFIGTGIMGAPMVRNLLKAGFSVAVHNRTRSKAEPLLKEGAEWGDTPADVAAGADFIISMVSDSPDVEEVYLGDSGVKYKASSKALCIDMSTISPQVTRIVAGKLQIIPGCGFLDAPVSGGKTGAETGRLAIMVGGEEADVAKAQPIFDVLGKATVHCGPVGFGQLTKLCNQILCGLNLLAVGEAMVFAKKLGLDQASMLRAVSQGAAGSWAVDNLGSRMLARDFAPMFMIDLQQKDLRIALEVAGTAELPLPGTSLVRQLLTANQDAGEGREGTQALIKTLERLSLVE